MRNKDIRKDTKSTGATMRRLSRGSGREIESEAGDDPFGGIVWSVSIVKCSEISSEISRMASKLISVSRRGSGSSGGAVKMEEDGKSPRT